MRHLQIVLLLTVLLLACSSSDKDEKDGGAAKDSPAATDRAATPETPGAETPERTPDTKRTEPLRFVTWNAGLAENYVPYTPERVTKVVAALTTLEADVVCLQEVWEAAECTAVLDGTKEAFPHQLLVETEESGGGAPDCTDDELKPLKACVEEHCKETDDLTGCVMDNCGTEFAAVSQDCITCLAANISKPVDEIFSTCTEEGAKLTYDGRNGLVILSRLPLEETGHFVMDSFLLRRVVLQAQVQGPDGPVHVFCTHLTAEIGEVPYNGDHESYEKEQAFQIDQMLAMAKDVGGDAPKVLMGDMNCGPKKGDLIGGWEENFAKFVDDGWLSPYLEAENPPCTWCGDNHLIDYPTSKVIDHVLFKNLAIDGAQAERIMDQEITIETRDGDKQVNLSDHFGVRVTMPAAGE